MSENTGRRPLTQSEIDRLIQNGCTAGDWNNISVADDFSPGSIINAHFSGKVSIGSRVIIRNVSDPIANYDIGDNVFINDVKSLMIVGASGFGNGVRAAVVNENGGRAFPIYEGLGAQVAYLLAIYKHQPQLQEKLEALIAAFVKERTSEQGIIGDGTHITHCGVIRNVQIGTWARLEGVSRLENGTILSDSDGCTVVGTDVIAKDFIFAEGAKVTDAARLRRCFVGQGVTLENGFSAVDSVFFANSHFEQGEACSVFAGPFSVSHHKSTLLIAGLYSFYNAGSGTNQSNHMYKLGPVHQGILERGCKTGSESYLIWPVRTGAFSTVIGKHEKKMDLSNLPFSCLIERQGKSQLFAGLNLTNVGLVRDEKKWPARDRRKAPRLLDWVNTGVFTPYTAQKMLAGIDLLNDLQRKHLGSDAVIYSGVHIPSPQRAVELYRLALDKYYAEVLANRMQAIFASTQDRDNISSLKQSLVSHTEMGVCRWVDVAGLLAPVDALNKLLDDIQASRLNTLDEINKRFEALHTSYAEYEWAWVLNQLQTQQGRPLPEWSKEDFKTILSNGLQAEEKLTALLLEDAAKEFSLGARIGYGIDNPSETAADFENVCGTLQTHATVKMLQESLEAKKTQVGEITRRLL